MCFIAVDSRWNFSVGNFELKLLPETQAGMNFLEGEVASGDAWRGSRRFIADQTKEGGTTEDRQKQNLKLVIKVSVPDWKVMAFSTAPDGQLVWERQVRDVTNCNLAAFKPGAFAAA